MTATAEKIVTAFYGLTFYGHVEASAWLRAHISAAIHAEREACARVAEADTSFDMLQDFGIQSHSAQIRENIAAAIRARGSITKEDT